MAPVEAMLVGAGQRGRYVYSAFAKRHPDRMRIVSVVEPHAERRRWIADTHGIPLDRQHDRWETAFGARPGPPVVIVASPDRHHAGPAIAALDTGSHVLLEKPVAHSLEAAIRVHAAARASSASLHVAHVLRYTPFFSTLNDLIGSGRLGELVNVVHRENVVSWHMAHSFVRGNWARSGESTPMIVQKCCHDFDIMTWNLDSPVSRLHSFGSLMHFRPEHAPEGAAERCLDCSVSETCPFDAQRIYLDPARTGWPVHVVTDDLTEAGRREALRTGPYGRCVYTAGSDVVDHQTVSMELESGATATLIMHGHAHRENRTMRYDGTHGTVRATFGGEQMIEFTNHRGGRPETVPIAAAIGGHGGGDTGLINSFLAAVEAGSGSKTSGDSAIESHLLAFSAEESRHAGTVIDISRRRVEVAGR